MLTTQLEDPNSGFPHPPPSIPRLIFVVLFDLLIKFIMSLPILILYNRIGKYYLVDSGYSNKLGYLHHFVTFHITCGTLREDVDELMDQLSCLTTDMHRFVIA